MSHSSLPAGLTSQPQMHPELWNTSASASGSRSVPASAAPLINSATAKIVGWPPGVAGPQTGLDTSLVASSSQAAPQDSITGRNAKVFSVMDRQVHLRDVESPPELYVVCRKWVHNDAENDVETIPSQPNMLQLPQVKPKDDLFTEPPLYADNFDDYDPEEALRRLKEHWVAVRQWHIGVQKQQCGRFTDRMKAMMPGAMLQVTPATAARGPAASASVLQ